MFADLLGRMSAEKRLAGTLGVAAAGYFSKIDVLRVHDVGLTLTYYGHCIRSTTEAWIDEHPTVGFNPGN